MNPKVLCKQQRALLCVISMDIYGSGNLAAKQYIYLQETSQGYLCTCGMHACACVIRSRRHGPVPSGQCYHYPDATIFLQASEFKVETKLGTAAYIPDPELCGYYGAILTSNFHGAILTSNFQSLELQSSFLTLLLFQEFGRKGYMKCPEPVILYDNGLSSPPLLLVTDKWLSENYLKQVSLGQNFLKETLVASKLATKRNQTLVKGKSLI